MGGVFAVQSYEKLREKKFKGVVISLIAAVYIAVFLFDAYRFCEKYIMRVVRPDGTHIIAENGKHVAFDNGPINFGGRAAIPIREGDVIEKTFAGVPSDAQGVLTIAPIYNALLLEVNGRKLLWRADKANRNIAVPCKLVNGRAVLKILRINADESVMLIDTQRDYGRSFLNGEVIDAEWEMRFYY